MPEDQILAERATRAPQPVADLVLWAWHQVPFKVFRAMRRQVRTRGPVVVGLDLTVLPIVERRLGLGELTPEQLQALDTMSDECVDVMNQGLERARD